MLKRTITIGEAIVSALTLLGVIIGFYTHVQIALSEMNLRLNILESGKVEAQQRNEKIDNKLEAISNGINDIKIQLNNKQDKK
ncbi:MAG: hypothetical protein KGO82_14385 [Bacteroidota bacterium]|nr:hypothetical protein [Bacteroidota bacterium]